MHIIYTRVCTCNCLMLIRRSDSLNPYGMFQPSGPNFFLSWTRAWKKQTPYRSFSQTYKHKRVVRCHMCVFNMTILTNITFLHSQLLCLDMLRRTRGLRSGLIGRTEADSTLDLWEAHLSSLLHFAGWTLGTVTANRPGCILLKECMITDIRQAIGTQDSIF